jgi:hypothetical protein
MSLAIFRCAKAEIIVQALSQGHRISVSKQIAAGAVATDVIRVQGFLEGLGLVATKVTDGS